MSVRSDDQRPASVRVVRWMLLALAVQLLVMLGTGLWLAWNYTPGDMVAWPDLKSIDRGSVPLVQGVHQVVSGMFTLTAVGTAICAVTAAVSGAMLHRVITGVAAASVLLVSILMAFTGYLLPWDGVALWRVTVGSNAGGIFATQSDDVKYVIFGDQALSGDAYARWMWLHIAVLPVLAVLLGAAVWRLSRWRRAHLPAST